ncbi:MAG: hypothetical protein IH614_15185 [Desulfuromonadales bacterium]|nr:hypothetical protein [Desulfuromonadales bacterium]
MDLTTLVIGGATALFGATTLVMRLVWPQRLKDIAPMQARFGAVAGSAIHLTGYTLLPLFFGLFCLYLAFTGSSIVHQNG